MRRDELAKAKEVRKHVIRPSIFYTYFSPAVRVVRGLLEPIPVVSRRRQVPPRAVFRPNLNNHSHSHLNDSVEFRFPIHLTCIALDCGSMSENLERTHARQLQTERARTRGLNPQPSCCRGDSVGISPTKQNVEKYTWLIQPMLYPARHQCRVDRDTKFLFILDRSY